MFLSQILAELDRILQRDAAKQLRETWSRTVPKILEIARDEGSSFVQALLKDATSKVSEG